MLSFVHWYNTQHKHSGLKFITPHQRHSGEAEMILNYREQVYRSARAQHPEREWLLEESGASGRVVDPWHPEVRI